MSAVQTFETPEGVSLRVRLPTGRVVVGTADAPRTTVELVPLGRRGQDALEDVEVRIDERRGGHVITIEQRDRFRFGPIQISWGADLEARITCPPGSNLELSSGSTDLRVDGELGDVEVKTASGDVELDSVRGKLQVKTASGDVSVGVIESDATLTTVSGDLRIDRLRATLEARSVSGDVTIGEVAAPPIPSTTSGDVDLDTAGAGEVRVQTISGDARIGIARGMRVWIDAASVSGALESGLGLADQVPDADSGEGQGPVVPLRVKTVSGDVSVARAAERAAS